MEAKHTGGEGRRYPSDLSDAQWALLEPLLPRPQGPGRRPTLPRRRIVEGLLYLERTGCQWRAIPREFGAWGRETVESPDVWGLGEAVDEDGHRVVLLRVSRPNEENRRRWPTP